MTAFAVIYVMLCVRGTNELWEASGLVEDGYVTPLRVPALNFACDNNADWELKLQFCLIWISPSALLTRH